MRCIAIDDEKLALDLLEDNIRQVPFLQMAARCRNVMEAMEILNREKIDLIFLDIQMPGITGLQFLKSLPERPLTVLVTAYNNHALEGYDMNAIDYLLKPVSFDRFLKACNKAYEYYKPRTKPAENVSAGRDYFFVNVEYNQVKLNYQDIRFIEAMKDYVRIHLVNGKPVVTRQSMKAIEEKLPSTHFVRVHKSYIVSVDKIQAIKRGLIVINDNELPLGDNYKSRVDCLLGIDSV